MSHELRLNLCATTETGESILDVEISSGSKQLQMVPRTWAQVRGGHVCIDRFVHG